MAAPQNHPPDRPIPERPARGSVARIPAWANLVGTFFGLGYFRLGPGTWASGATVLLWAAMAHLLPFGDRSAVAAVIAALIIAVGIPAATQVSRSLGSEDPQIVVIDEVAGQMIALIAVPLAWKTFLAGFILFRALDITKPPPVRQLESLPEGVGVVLDDVAAGVYALICMQLLVHSGLLR